MNTRTLCAVSCWADRRYYPRIKARCNAFVSINRTHGWILLAACVETTWNQFFSHNLLGYATDNFIVHRIHGWWIIFPSLPDPRLCISNYFCFSILTVRSRRKQWFLSSFNRTNQKIVEQCCCQITHSFCFKSFKLSLC